MGKLFLRENARNLFIFELHIFREIVPGNLVEVSYTIY